jgi:hypothetical protein
MRTRAIAALVSAFTDRQRSVEINISAARTLFARLGAAAVA